MLKENVLLVLFFTLAGAFVIFMNLQGYYIIKLNKLLKKRYSNLHKRLILIDFSYSLFVPRPIKLFKYIWFEKSYEKDIFIFIKKIRLFLKLAFLSIILLIFGLFFIEAVF